VPDAGLSRSRIPNFVLRGPAGEHQVNGSDNIIGTYRIGPAPADQPPVPAQQRIRRHQPAHPQRPGEGGPGQRARPGRPSPVQLRPGVLPPQHRDFVAQHQQLGILRRRRTHQQRHPVCQADEHQVEHPYHHKPAMLPAARPTPQANPQVSPLCTVLEPYTSWCCRGMDSRNCWRFLAGRLPGERRSRRRRLPCHSRRRPWPGRSCPAASG
jgi:hypothetical protein